MSAPNLYAMGEAFLTLEAKLDDLLESGVPEAEALVLLRAEFDALADDLTLRCEAAIRFVRTQEALAAAAKEEAKRLTTLAKTREAKVERLEQVIRVVLATAGTTKVTTALGVVGIRANGGKAPLEIDDVDADVIAQTNPDLVVTTTAINKEAVRAHLDAGGTLPFARLLPRGTNVRVG